jgi:transcriptional regulator with GAF, ATPase, and Fis domain
MEALFELARQIIQPERPEDVLGEVVKSALALLGGDRGFLVLVKGDAVEYKVIRNWSPEEYEGQSEPLSRGILSEVLQREEPILIEDASSDPRFSERRSVQRHFIRSVLAAPISANREKAGVLYLESRSMKRFFGQSELTLFEKIVEISSQALESTIQRALWERASLQERLEKYKLSGIITHDARFVTLLETVALAANSRLPVLIQGESGTGKELIARALHANSPRSKGPFLTINCGAISANLLESELFGHTRGAFTGASQSKTGYIASAHQGTIFLDEIGELPKELQVKLLCTLQFGEVQPVGSVQPERYDVRFIAATNRDLEQEVKAGNFRQDFLYRLNAIAVRLPPLRERPGDIVPLFYHFLQRSAEQEGRQAPKLDSSIEALLRSHQWPGNIRELENEAMRLVVLTPIGASITPSSFSFSHSTQLKSASTQTLQEQEKALVEHHLRLAGDNRTKAAKSLGISRETLRQMMKRHQIT